MVAKYLTELQKTIVENMRNGFPILCTLGDAKTHYSCGNMSLRETTIKSLKGKGYIKANDDSIIQDSPQTYGLIEE